jgi:hypothetical protein
VQSADIFAFASLVPAAAAATRTTASRRASRCRCLHADRPPLALTRGAPQSLQPRCARATALTVQQRVRRWARVAGAIPRARAGMAHACAAAGLAAWAARAVSCCACRGSHLIAQPRRSPCSEHVVRQGIGLAGSHDDTEGWSAYATDCEGRAVRCGSAAATRRAAQRYGAHAGSGAAVRRVRRALGAAVPVLRAAPRCAALRCPARCRVAALNARPLVSHGCRCRACAHRDGTHTPH